MTDLDAKLFDALNSTPDYTAPQFLSPEFYGDYEVEHGQKWQRKYMHYVQFTTSRETGGFEIAYDRWQPKGVADTGKLPIVVLLHGVPVNRHEWYEVARMLARFAIVYTVDLLGMGWSSKPLNFDWTKSWDLQAHIFSDFIQGKGRFGKKEHYEEFRASRPVFLGGNDWGGGIVQRAINVLGGRNVTKMEGYILGSPIALNGYWVQQIGALRALAEIPFLVGEDQALLQTFPESERPAMAGTLHPMFRAQAQAFVGTLTTLLETMHQRPGEKLNQYSLAPLQAPYVDVSTYMKPGKNPGNTDYHYGAIRVLAQQATSALGNGLLLPFHPRRNRNGIKFSEWNTPVLVMWGMQDKMMPASQLFRFENIAHAVQKQRPDSRFFVVGALIDNAGHFATTDQPEKTADAILRFLTMSDDSRLHQPYLGFEGIARQDEKHVTESFKKILELSVAQEDTGSDSEDDSSSEDPYTCDACGMKCSSYFEWSGTRYYVCDDECMKDMLKRLSA